MRQQERENEQEKMMAFDETAGTGDDDDIGDSPVGISGEGGCSSQYKVQDLLRNKNRRAQWVTLERELLSYPVV